MFNLYLDSGTSNTRAYLIDGQRLVDTAAEGVGTKDSAINGSNDVLINGMKKCCDILLDRNGITYDAIDSIWSSGMVTNPFGIKEVQHVSTPIDGKKLLDNVYTHFEDKAFNREILLVPGIKTAQPGQMVDMENIGGMNNVRGEEIEAVGLAASGILPDNAVMLSPGSHTHILHIENGAVTDILSNFTGELNFAIKKDTILGGELSDKDVPMVESEVMRGYGYLKRYSLCRALYIVHATRVFDVCPDEHRNSLLAGIISGSVIDVLKLRIDEAWKGVEKIVVLGGKNYIDSYTMLCRKILPEIPVEAVKDIDGRSFALCGFLELLRLRNEN